MLIGIITIITAMHGNAVIDDNDTIPYQVCIERMVEGSGDVEIEYAIEACEDYPQLSLDDEYVRLMQTVDRPETKPEVSDSIIPPP